MTTKHKAKHVFDGAVTFNDPLTIVGAVTQTGDLAVTGAISASTTVTAGTGLTVTSGGATVTGNSTINGVVSIGSTPITLTDNATKLTCSHALEATGAVFASSYLYGTYVVETTAAAAVSDSTYTVAAGVHVVKCTSTGAGGPYAITLGTNNGVNHHLTVYCAAYNTSAFTIACVQGTVTLDATGESASFIYDGTNWICTAVIGAAAPA